MGVRQKKEIKSEKFKFTEGFIQEALSHFFSPNSVKYDIDGLYVFDWESDKLLETKTGYIYEFEIKISKADFKNDFKHKQDKHIILEGAEKYNDNFLPRYYNVLEENRKYNHWCEENFIKSAANNPVYLTEGHRRPNYFYYAVPEGLITEEDVPEYAGLIYVNEYQVLSVIKKAPCLHKEKYTDAELNLSEKFYYNMVHWHNKFKREKREKEYSEKRLLEEISAKGQGLAYTDLEQKYNELKKTLDEQMQNSSKSETQLHRDLYRQNRAVAMLAREIRKYNPEFNLWAWEDEHFGKED